MLAGLLPRLAVFCWAVSVIGYKQLVCGLSSNVMSPCFDLYSNGSNISCSVYH